MVTPLAISSCDLFATRNLSRTDRFAFEHACLLGCEGIVSNRPAPEPGRNHAAVHADREDRHETQPTRTDGSETSETRANGQNLRAEVLVD